MGELKGQGYLYGQPEDAAAIARAACRQLGLLAKRPEPAARGDTRAPMQRKAG